jgi:hypothetical protein
MPEQISKYPEVTLKVLKGAGARCGEGAEQKILTRCPQDRFCSLPTGEICVYGIDQISHMTQITGSELARAIGLRDQLPSTTARPLTSYEMAIVAAVLILGLLLGRLWGGLKKR